MSNAVVAVQDHAKPAAAEIDDVLIWCFEAMDNGSHFPGMTYEQGVDDAIRWMQGEGTRPDCDD